MSDRRILIVEDEPAGAKVLQQQLRLLGYRSSSVVASGEAAIDLVGHQAVDLVIMDISLKGAKIQGPEAAEKIYQAHNVPVIFLSAYDMPDIVDLVRRTNAYGYVAKPPEEQDLMRQIELALSKHEMESRVTASNKRLTAILQTALDSIITIDRNGVVIEFNPAAEDTFGYRRAEIVGKRMSDLIVPPEYREAHLEGMRRYFETGKGPVLGKRIEISAMHSSGRIFPVELAITPHEDRGEQFFTAYLRDITERKVNEELLQKRDTLLNAVAAATTRLIRDTHPEPAFKAVLEILGIAVEADRVFIFENSQLQESQAMFVSLRYEWCSEGIAPQLGKPALKRWPYAPNYSRWQKLLAQGRSINGVVDELPAAERTLLRRQGIKSLLVVPILIDDDFWGFIGFDYCRAVRRWTEHEQSILIAMAGSIGSAIARKRSLDALHHSQYELSNHVKELEKRESELQQTTALLIQQEKLATLGTIAGGVAHEINSPLGAVLNCAERLNSEDLSREARQRNLQLILNAALRVKSVVDKFLLTARPRGQLETCNAGELVEDWFALYGKQLELCDIVWRVDVPADLTLPLAYSDGSQVLTNLLLNARDALCESDDDGPREISLLIKSHPEAIDILIEDNGPGIDPGIVPHIFDAFVTTKEQGRGTGLGLWITRNIVEEAGGSLSIENIKTGTLVVVRLPGQKISQGDAGPGQASRSTDRQEENL